MKRGAVLINASRAVIVDEAALVEALSEHRLAGAGIDVYNLEPLILTANPFGDLDNVVVTAHNG